MTKILGLKREEAIKIENKKAELLNYWKNIRQTTPEPSPEKFNVIEGRKRIDSKISQLVNETKNQMSIVSNTSEFIRVVQCGLLETDVEQTKSRIHWRLLTEVPNRNLRAINVLLKEMGNKKVFVETRTLDLGLGLTPRMLIRDEEEAMFFLSPNQGKFLTEDNLTCLCTNSKALVQSFIDIFEGMWKNSTDFHNKATVSVSGAMESLTSHVVDPELSLKKYEESMNSAKKSVLILTSIDGLMDFASNIELLKVWSSRGIPVKIMAPITADNFKKAQELMQFCEIRHIPNSISRGFVLIDGKELFQLYSPIKVEQKTSTRPLVGFTNNVEFVKRTETMLKELWKNAVVPSIVNMEFIRKKASADFPKRSTGVTTPLCRLDGHSIIEEKLPSEKDIVNRIITATKQVTTVSSKEFKAYCSMGQAVIHLPRRFNTPDLLLFAQHFEKQSSLGEEDALIISLWLETPKGFSYVPAAIVQNNPLATEVWKKFYDKTPAGQNVQFVKNDDLEIRLHGNIFFTGWNKEIPLLPPKYFLPAGCIILETYSKVLTQSYTIVAPSGFSSKIEGNGFHAFVNFISSTANYNGPGTDGYVTRDGIMTTNPPSS